MSDPVSDIPLIIQWANFYADKGFSVIPTAEGEKRPGLAKWEEWEVRCPDKNQISLWLTGFYRNSGIGVVTGTVSGNVFVVDADAGEGKQGPENLDEVLMMNDDFPITWTSKTGGGGRHYFFRAPPGVRIKTGKNILAQHIDVRGEGGFLVLPPSPHPSGQAYEWIPGVDPATTEIADAPDWLVAICRDDAEPDFLAPRAARPAVAGEFNAFGRRLDGREEYMRDLLWARLIEERRECPFPLTHGILNKVLEDCWGVYERKVKARSGNLEIEGRGIDEMRRKLKYAVKKWDTKIAFEASLPRRSGAWQDIPQREQAPQINPVVPLGSDRFRFETIPDLRKLPPAKWLVRGWIPEGSTTIVYGKWGAGKSFLGFDLSLHMAYGMSDWHGAELPEGGADVLVLAREGHQGFVQRIDAFKKHHGLIDDTGRMIFMRASVSFMRDEEFGALCTAIKEQNRQFRLVLIDTVARVLPGVEMSKPETITLFMERCSIVSSLTNAATVGVHHENKTGTMMGSVYFEANSDVVYEVTRLGEEDDPLGQGEVLCTKMKDGPDRWKRTVTYKPISLATVADPELSSLIVEAIDDRSIKRDGLPPKDVCIRVLVAIGEAWVSGRPLSHMPQAQKHGRSAQRVLSQNFQVPVKQVEQLLTAWFDEGVVSYEMVNTDTKMKGLRVIGTID